MYFVKVIYYFWSLFGMHWHSYCYLEKHIYLCLLVVLVIFYEVFVMSYKNLVVLKGIAKVGRNVLKIFSI